MPVQVYVYMMKWNSMEMLAVSVNRACSKIKCGLIASILLYALTISERPEVFLQMQLHSGTELLLSHLNFYHDIRDPWLHTGISASYSNLQFK